MKDLIVVTDMNDNTKATLTVTKLTQDGDQLSINAYPFQIPRNEMRPGQFIKAKHYPDPDFKLSSVYKARILSIHSGKRIISIHLQLDNNHTHQSKSNNRTWLQRVQGVLKSLASKISETAGQREFSARNV